jgi:hypothetical protein
MKGPWRTLALLCAVGVVAGASIAVAAPSGSSSSSSSKSSSGSSSQTMHEFRRGPGPRGADLSALADELGVTAARLRSALNAVRDEVRPPSWRRNGPPTRRQMEAACTRFTDALGDELGKSGDEVRDAIKQVAKDRLDAAVKAGRLTENEADEIRERIDSSDCAPIGPGGPGFGCGGRGGPGHGPGGPPPGAPDDNDGRNGGSGTSAPPAAPQTLPI